MSDELTFISAAYMDRTLIPVVFDAIRYQIEQHLFETCAVSHQAARTLLAAGDYANTARLGQGVDQGKAFLQLPPQRHGFQADREFSRLDTGQVQHFIDQFEQMCTGTPDLLHTVVLHRRQRTVWIAFQQLGAAENGVHGCA